MTEMVQKTAEVLAFRPARAAQAVKVEQPPANATNQEAQERLARALVRLNGALAEQRIAALALKTAVGDLHGAMGSLGQSLKNYNSQLGTVATRVGMLREQAIALEAWADRALATADQK